MTADHGDPEFIYTILDDDNSNDNNQIKTRHNVQHILSTIEHAAHTASRIAISTSGIIDIQRTKANTRDLVTDSDIQCQNVIREIIMREFPTALFLGEEDVVVDNSKVDELMKLAPSEDKTLKKYAALHGLLCEPAPLLGIIEDDLIQWLKKRCQ